MPATFTDRELEAFLEETLSGEAAAELEQALRGDEALRGRLAAVLSNRDRGDHSLGAIWQRNRVTCADRSTLGAYLLDLLDEEEQRYYDRHLNVVGCRYCLANLDDMRRRRDEQPAASDFRRQRFFESSVGRLQSRGLSADE